MKKKTPLGIQLNVILLSVFVPHPPHTPKHVQTIKTTRGLLLRPLLVTSHIAFCIESIIFSSSTSGNDLKPAFRNVKQISFVPAYTI